MNIYRVDVFSRIALTSAVLAVLLLFGGLTPLGALQDEYYLLSDLHKYGFNATLHRIASFSPRPLSEFLLYFYLRAIDYFKQPLTSQFVLLFWLLLLLSIFLPTWRSRPAQLSAIGMLAMLLLGHDVAEVFYWPAAVAPYLPTVAAGVGILALDWGGSIQRSSGQNWLTVWLVIAATSSEVGAIFAAIYSAMAMLFGRTSGRRRVLLYALPLLVSFVILYIQFSGRVALNAEAYGDASVAHNFERVLWTLKDTLLFQLFKGDNGQSLAETLTSGIITKSFFFIGVYLAMSAKKVPSGSQRKDQIMRLVLVTASTLTAVLTLAASLYHFGEICCERHDTMRQIFVLIAIGSSATYMAVRAPAKSSLLAGPALIVAVLIPLQSAIPKLVHDYGEYSFYSYSLRIVWQTGFSADTNMTVPQVLPGQIFGSAAQRIGCAPFFPPGTYERSKKGDSIWDQMLFFYKKKSITLTEPIDNPGSLEHAAKAAWCKPG